MQPLHRFLFNLKVLNQSCTPSFIVLARTNGTDIKSGALERLYYRQIIQFRIVTKRHHA